MVENQNGTPLILVRGPSLHNTKVDQLVEQARIGFLELQGTERLFALDGQHRVAGIKKALEDGENAAERRYSYCVVCSSF